jgi:hypothetical protein
MYSPMQLSSLQFSRRYLRSIRSFWKGSRFESVAYFPPFPLVFRASTANVPVPPLRLPSPSTPHPLLPLPRLLLLLSLMHPPMPLQLIAPRERFPTSRFEARVLALGRVHSEVFRQVGRFRKGGGTAGEGAREGARTGVRACFWRAAGR